MTARQQLHNNNNNNNTTFTTSYSYGDVARRQDMNKDTDPKVAHERTAALRIGDTAFIRRTEGQWTNAKVKDISSNNIIFTVDGMGLVKSYKIKYWSTHIRTLTKKMDE